MKNPEEIQTKYVKDFYNKNASSFSNTRFEPWLITDKFNKEYIKEDSLILDCGCGNGRNILVPSTIGLDLSIELLRHVKNENLGLINSDSLNLPFKNDTFDIVLSVSVIHHFTDEEKRLKSLLEIQRILKVGGESFYLCLA